MEIAEDQEHEQENGNEDGSEFHNTNTNPNDSFESSLELDSSVEQEPEFKSSDPLGAKQDPLPASDSTSKLDSALPSSNVDAPEPEQAAQNGDADQTSSDAALDKTVGNKRSRQPSSESFFLCLLCPCLLLIE